MLGPFLELGGPPAALGGVRGRRARGPVTVGAWTPSIGSMVACSAGGPRVARGARVTGTRPALHRPVDTHLSTLGVLAACGLRVDAGIQMTVGKERPTCGKCHAHLVAWELAGACVWCGRILSKWPKPSRLCYVCGAKHDNDLRRAEHLLETAHEWRRWWREIPNLCFPVAWAVRMVPPVGGAVVRFEVDDRVSVYLDCYGVLGAMDEPYWEIYPDEHGGNSRYLMAETEGLIAAIGRALESNQKETEHGTGQEGYEEEDEEEKGGEEEGG